MSRLSLILSAAVLGLLFVGDASAQCLRQGGGGGAPASSSRATQSAGSQGGFQGGSPAGQLLTDPGSYFHDVMMQNRMRQQVARQQAMIAFAKQAKRNTRKQAQLETRKKQREAELARREEKKRQAQVLAQLQTSTRTQ